MSGVEQEERGGRRRQLSIFGAFSSISTFRSPALGPSTPRDEQLPPGKTHAFPDDDEADEEAEEEEGAERTSRDEEEEQDGGKGEVRGSRTEVSG